MLTGEKTIEARIKALNDGGLAAFMVELGPIYEHSPWVAERAAALRPFSSLPELHQAMQACVFRASEAERMALLRAHPELAGREAMAGALTEASSGEQGRLGLDQLSGAEFERLRALNQHYQDRFGFPCIIALRLHASRPSVFAEFERRLGQDTGAEMAAALNQIGEITRGRLAALFGIAKGRLSMHVLNTRDGIPAEGMGFALFMAEAKGEATEAAWKLLASGLTNAQGRTPSPLLADIDMIPARYRLRFDLGDYFCKRGVDLPKPAFLEKVSLDFGISQPDEHYHVPLLCTPWSYSTYRGS